MDRLVCGDVGFGKQVAIRAALKAVDNSKVAIFGSTILAYQHYRTFTD
jgi:transcription-repair coupling factor (superfamily II helicase)